MRIGALHSLAIHLQHQPQYAVRRRMLRSEVDRVILELSHAAALLTLPIPGFEGKGPHLLLFLMLVDQLSDVLQYVWGKLLGRHKIIPSVSPNKTWEGFVGGIASACGVSLALRFLTPFSVRETLLVSFIVCLAGFFGGAVMSAVKRDFGVKDFGALIPGHGGMLDRLDSLCYAAPLFFHYVRYFHYYGFGVW